MKLLLVIALTAVFIGYTSAGFGCFSFKCLGEKSDFQWDEEENEAPQGDNMVSQDANRASQVDNRVPQVDNSVPVVDNIVPQDANRASQVDNRVPQGNNRASQSDNTATRQEEKRPLGWISKEEVFRSSIGRIRRPAIPQQDDNKDCMQGLPEFPCCGPPLMFVSGEFSVEKSNCGKTFQRRCFNEVPRVIWDTANEKAEYTVFVIIGKTVHWAVRDIPGSVLRGIGEIAAFTQLMDYKSLPTIPDGQTSAFLAVIYRQTERTRTTLLPPLEGTVQITEGFVQKHDLYGPRAAIGAYIENGPRRILNF